MATIRFKRFSGPITPVPVRLKGTTITLKRQKNFNLMGGIGAAASNTLGGITSAAGRTLDSGIGGLVGGVAGAHLGGQALGAGINALTGNLLGPVGSLLGYMAAYKMGNAATREVGKGLKEAGDEFRAQ